MNISEWDELLLNVWLVMGMQFSFYFLNIHGHLLRVIKFIILMSKQLCLEFKNHAI